MHSRLRRSISVTGCSALLLSLAVTLAGATPAQAAASTTVTNTSSYVDSSGIRHLVGEVTNNGDVPVLAPLVDLEVQNSTGTTVETLTATAVVNALAPGESSPFEGQTTVADFGSFRAVGTTAEPATFTPNHNLTACVTQVFGSGGKDRQLSGTVRNDNTSSADAPALFVSFYDAGGVIVGYDQASTDTTNPIGPGASARFSEVVNNDLPAYSRYAILTESSSPGEATSRSTCEPPPAETTLNCNPSMVLSRKAIVTGQDVKVTVTGTPRSVVTLEGYSRPSTAYAPIRKDVQLDDGGQVAPFVVRPATAARIRMQVRGCSTPGTGQVISVTPVLTITVERKAAFQFRFAGKISPAAANTGRLMTLYIKPASGAPIRKGTARSLKDGTYSVTLTFPRAPAKTLSLYWATGADQTNSAASSAVRAVTIS